MYALFASFVALREGSLWLICGIHAGWNYFQGNIFGVPVSGNPEANSLLAFGPTEGSNEALTGGDFGIEASLVGTLILAIALVIAFISFRRAQAGRAAETALVATPSAATVPRDHAGLGSSPGRGDTRLRRNRYTIRAGLVG